MFVWWLHRVHGNVPEEDFFSLFKALPAGESLEGWLKECVVHNYLEKQSGMLGAVTKRAINNIQKDKTRHKCFKGYLASFNSPHRSLNREARKMWDSMCTSQAQLQVLPKHETSCGAIAGREQPLQSFPVPCPWSRTDLSLPVSTGRCEVTDGEIWDQRCSVPL